MTRLATVDRGIFARAEGKMGPLLTAITTAISAQALSFFLYSYAFWIPVDGRWSKTIAILIKDPWTHADVFEPQIRHRILGPLIANLLGLGDRGYLVWVLANFVLLATVYLLLRNRGVIPSAAGLTTMALATTLVVVTSQTWLGYPDSLAMLFLTLCLATRQKALLAICAGAAMLTDERVAAAFPLVVIWHSMHMSNKARKWGSISLACTLGLVVIGWIAFYAWITGHFAIPKTVMGEVLTGYYLLAEPLWVPVGIFFGLRFLWLLVGLGPSEETLERLGGRKSYWIATFVAIVPGALVGDVSRGAALAFPSVLIVVADRARQRPRATTGLLLVIFLANIMTPQFQIFGQAAPLFPLPISLLRMVLGT